MDDTEFLTAGASLLARCSPDQRARLADMARTYGKPNGGAEDGRLATRDVSGAPSPYAGQSFDKMFPDAKRLTG